MNLKIKETGLNFKITNDELLALIDGKLVFCENEFFKIKIAQGSDCIKIEQNSITLLASVRTLEKLQERSKNGVNIAPNISLQVDVRSYK